MDVFGGQSSMQTGSQKGHSDNALKTNYHGSAPLDASITSESWLKPTTGVDCKLVHGDRWQEIKGAMTQHIQDKKISTYDQEFSETYNSDLTRNMNATAAEHYFGTVGRDYLARPTESYLAGKEEHNAGDALETHVYKAEAISSVAWEAVPLKIDTVGLEIAVPVVGEVRVSAGFLLEASSVGIFAHRWEFKNYWLKQEAAAMESKIVAMQEHIGTLQSKMRPLEVIEGILFATNQKI